MLHTNMLIRENPKGVISVEISTNGNIIIIQQIFLEGEKCLVPV